MKIYDFKFPGLISGLFLLMILAGCAGANRSPGLSVSNQRTEAVQLLPQEKEPSFDYIVGPEDILFISILQDKDLDTEAIVRPDGKISLRLIGEVKASGKTLAQLSSILTKKYAAYIISPEVLVTIRKFGGAKVIILGQVRNPGVYRPIAQTSLLEVIAMAGGFTNDAVLNSVILIRGNLDKPQAVRLNLAKAIQKTDLQQNITIAPNDIVYVPKKFIANVNYYFDQYLGPLLKAGQAASYYDR